MDFGQVGIDGFVGQGQDSAVPGFGQEPKTKSSGSGLAKKERSIGDSGPVEVVDCRASKVSRGAADGLVLYKTLPVHHQGNPGLRSTSSQPQMQMLSFSSPKQEVSFLSEESGRAVVGAGACGFGDKSAQNMPLSYYQYTTPSAYTRNSGFVCGTMNGSFTGTKGPFTPAQWIELEHQALIYKYLDANVPVPANLLIPIKKALFSTGFSGFAAASFPPHPLPYGWGPFHLGFSGGTDPEPGRCRRTDGKKWRCSREAVPDQKYCERHMNRSRHRSRKPVEGQKGQVASAPTNTKVVPVPVSMSSSLSSSVTANGCASNNPAIARNQFKGLEAGNTNPSYTITERHQDSQGLPMVPPNVSQKSKESPFSILKQDITFEEYHQQEFGIVSSDSLLNPSQKSSYVSSSRDDKLFPDFSDQRMKNEHPLRHFIDEWPKTQTDHSSGAWSEELKSDWTQLSISIPMSLDFSSSSSSPDVHKTSLCPLRSSRGNLTGLSWGNPMGGPLAEVINKAGSSARPYKNTSVLNFMGEGWDGSSPMGSSPTDVLQKATFISLSNSSSGSSPIADYKKTQESAGLCNDLLG